jgi:hypothetical protein
MPDLAVSASYEPTGDQPRAIAELTESISRGDRYQTLLGATATGKTHAMARVINTSIFVKNGPSFAGLGFTGEGYTSFTIASPTGEGLTTAVSFTRERRCTLKDYFRIV